MLTTWTKNTESNKNIITFGSKWLIDDRLE